MDSPVDALLDEALDKPERERESFLKSALSEDPDRFEALMSLVSEANSDDGFLTPGGAQQGAIFADLCDQLASSAEEPAQCLAVGDSIGRYRIVELIGRGGMGEVYRGRDTRLSRDVAIKVLPAEVSADGSRLARLRREARLLAALNDPRIAAIFDIEEHEGVLALVLELVEGPTLAARLAAGALPVSEALQIARQLAEALSVAHTRGIVHRDLKPANIKLGPNGTVKVLDFGLATATRVGSKSDDGESLATVEFVRGTVLGTPAYMSPEQARGEPVDPRADIWAFGCVLYEMLTGHRAFSGATSERTLEQVREHEPDYARLPAHTSPAVRRLLRRCLQKQASQRLGLMHDAILEIHDALTGTDDGAHTSVVPRSPRRRWRWPLTAAGLAIVTSLVGWLWTSRLRVEPSPLVTRLALLVPPDVSLISGLVPAFALSADGQVLVFRGEQNRVMKLFRRDLRRGEVVAIEGSDGAFGVFLSPDGRFAGFHREGTLMKASLAGGPATAICPAPSLTTATWNSDGRIIFATSTDRALYALREGDCDARPVTTLDEAQGEIAHGFPEQLPGGRAQVFTIQRRDGFYLAVQRFDTGEVRTLTAGQQARYLASGHLVFVRGTGLWAAPFDLDRFTLLAEPQLVESDLHLSRGVGTAHYAVSSANGSLVYASRAEMARERRLVPVNLSGQEGPDDFAPAGYTRVNVSPDGKRLALAIVVDNNSDIWVYERERRTTMRITVDPAVDSAPVWSRDSQSIVFRSDRAGGGLFRVAVGRTEPVERLTAPAGPVHTPYAFLPDDRTVLFTEFRSYSEQRVGALDLTTREIRWLLDDRAAARLRPDISPDGRWLTYQSNESGRFEVYICPYPNVKSRRWQISSGGGTSPRWSRDGRTLFYHDGRAFRAVTVTSADTLRVGSSRVLFEDREVYGDQLGPIYDLTPDGQLLIIRNPVGEASSRTEPGIRFVTNWSADVAARVPAPRRSWFAAAWPWR